MGQDNNDTKTKRKRKRSKEKKSAEKAVTNEEQKQQQQGNCSSNPSNKKKKKSQESCPFGNYKNYYGYRISNDMDEDPRLKVLKKEWFQGKDCLDIGCNSGVMTIHIAKKFGCRSILGVDIDSSLIEVARWRLRNFVRTQSQGEKKTGAADGSEEQSLSLSNGSSAAETKELFQVVSFQKENFVHSRNLDENRYDTILCLSVTKWVHLNWGDDGLITLFSKIWRLLNPGGIFVMEPQPWKSYEKNRRVSETTAMNYRNIVLRPEHFQNILLDKIGFRTVEDLTSSLSGASKGFDRQVLAFQK
ncbi:putative RNA methyltransferase [Raphanus sativus]|uniref:RNA methyltransferase n=1 Tax=Raphanus sativus TaxID=3726 RepID=A0A6J0MJR9_RAPSA|nr:probable RNA methyltransferase At5g51130 [Raphanus sativus]KAJ4907469.1 putative RNA methyltransferase [Raphanus sativus]